MKIFFYRKLLQTSTLECILTKEKKKPNQQASYWYMLTRGQLELFGGCRKINYHVLSCELWNVRGALSAQPNDTWQCPSRHIAQGSPCCCWHHSGTGKAIWFLLVSCCPCAGALGIVRLCLLHEENKILQEARCAAGQPTQGSVPRCCWALCRSSQDTATLLPGNICRWNQWFGC